MSSIDQTDLFKITNRALVDTLPERVDLAFLHGDSRDSQSSIMEAGAELYKKGLAKKIGIIWADESVYDEWMSRYQEANPDLAQTLRGNDWPAEDGCIAGYSGFKEWGRELEGLGVDRKSVVTIEPSFNHYFSTAGEASGLVQHCMENGVRNLSITSSPLQQTRSLITVVSALIHADATDINVYSYPGTPLEWNDRTVHCQGKLVGVRVELLEEELGRIIMYQTGGDLPLKTPGEVLEYLDQRG